MRDVLGGSALGPILKKGRQPLFKWQAGPKQATNSIKELFSFLQIKRRQAELALFFQKNRSRPVTPAELCWRNEIRRELHRLNGSKRRKRNALSQEILDVGAAPRKKQWPRETRSKGNPTLAYLAGLFDAEGCVTVGLLKQKARRQPLHRLFCKISMTDRAGPEMFLARFGGEIQKPERRKGRQPMHRWRIDANKAADFLEEIRPFMRIKHQQADLALELQRDWIRSNPTTHTELERRERIRQEISALNGIKKIQAFPFEQSDTLSRELNDKRAKFKRFLELDAQGLSSKAIAEALNTWPDSINRWKRQIPSYARDLARDD